jgi:hypothetical protein
MKPIRGRTLIVGLIVYTAVFTLLGVFVDKVLFLGLIGLAFARPVLREFRALEDRDERQVLASYRSSHIAFLVAMLIGGLAFLKVGIIDDGEPPQTATLMLFVALFVKFAMLQVHGRSRRTAGRWTAYVVSGAWLLFSLASHGFSAAGLIESSIWLVIFGSALAGRRWPKIGGALLVLEGVATLVFFGILSGRGFLAQYFVMLLLPLPLILAGALLLLPEDEDSGADDRPRDRATSSC